MSSIIEIENLSFGYTPTSIVLNDVSFEVKAGTFLAIVGPNGAGKSTLLNLICGALPFKTGTIRIDAAPVQSYSTQALATKLAVVRPEFVPVFGFTVIETVLMSRRPHCGSAVFESELDKQIASDALKATDTDQFASRALASLSGGERQRVFIARALAQETAILLLDEPTNFLDLKHQVGIYDLLKAAQLRDGKTIVAVTHDINLAIQYCDEVLLLGADGKYRLGKTEDVFSPEQIRRVFGIDVFTGEIGQEKFFMPLGKLAKNSGRLCKEPGDI